MLVGCNYAALVNEEADRFSCFSVFRNIPVRRRVSALCLNRPALLFSLVEGPTTCKAA